MRHPVEVAAVHNYSSYGGRMSVHILGGRVGHDVASPLERPTINRRGEGVVHDERHPVAMGDACELLNIQHAASRVGDGFAKHGARVGAERLLYLLFRSLLVDKGAVDAKFLHRHTKEVERSAVDLGGGHDVRPSLADVEHGVEVGGLSAGSEHGTHASFKGCYLLCHGVVGGVGQTGVEVARFLQVEELCHLLGVIIFESGTLINRWLNGLSVLWLPSSADAEGCRFQFLFHNVSLLIDL